MSSLDTAINNDAREGTCENEDIPRASHVEIHVSHAESIKSSEWQLATGPWSDFVALLLDHQEQDTKDGRAFLPGLLREQRRINAEVELLNLMVYDLDRGECLASVRQKVINSGYEAVLHSTYSHLTSRSVVALPACRAFVGQQNVEPDLVAQYLSEVKRFPSHVLEGLQVVSLDEHNGIMEVEHGPIEKYRLALLPDRAFSVADLLAQGMSLPAIKKLWKATYCAIGRHLGLEFDTACTARAYYLPSHAPGAPYVAEHLPGRPLPLESFIAQAMEAEDEPAADTTHDRGTDDTIVTDRDGCALDLRKWELKYRTTCHIVDVIRSCAPGLVNELGDNPDDKQHIHCPFEHDHSEPDQGSGTFVANPGRQVDGETVRVFTIHCRHAACSHRSRLDFLKGLIEGRHLTFADLNASANAAQDEAAEPVPEVAKYAKSWAFINAGGKALLLNTEERDLSKALMAEADFARIHRYDYDAGGNGQGGTVYYAKEFLKHPPRPQTKFYINGFCFKPGGDPDPGAFNLYRGLNVTASPSGSCELFRELIFDVWARGDKDLGEWLWEYFLHLVAHPGERIRTSIAIRGSQGAGKSIVFEMMRRILGDMLLVVDNQNIVLGAFNESLVGKLGVVLEEAAFAGDRGAFQKMKNLITGTTVMSIQNTRRRLRSRTIPGCSLSPMKSICSPRTWR